MGAKMFSLHGHDLPADPRGHEYMNTEINNMKHPSAGATDRGRAHVNTHISRQLISRPRRLGCSCRTSLWNRRLKVKRARGVVSVHEGGGCGWGSPSLFSVTWASTVQPSAKGESIRGLHRGIKWIHPGLRRRPVRLFFLFSISGYSCLRKKVILKKNKSSKPTQRKILAEPFLKYVNDKK